MAPNRDVEGFLRQWESVCIRLLAHYGIEARVRPQATGVWIGDRKVASIGIAIRKWVSFHGVALNCVNELKPFYSFSPCGFAPEVMTRVSDWTSLLPQHPGEWRSDLQRVLVDVLPQKVETVSFSDLAQAQSRVEALRQNCLL
jgi:lipoate-protein ligase B